ncbi:helix-turn-helix domain-containing protein [Nocardiopsis metallicus]|uniref:helix-turn-helix domain-containing protein n=1 Tax=Nocardiopsis metallicus TaxID=179819 RepID=UPI002483C68C|nr:XRE family transcriptional regulator [Nocardiopsis metallicus]
MLVLARESRGWTQSELASQMTQVAGDGGTVVSQGYVSKVEAGKVAVSPERLSLFASALGYPEHLFYVDPQVHGVGVGLIHHRKRASLPASALRVIHATLALVRIQINGLISALGGPERPVNFSHKPIAPLRDAKRIAREVRQEWGLPPGPVDNVIKAAEDAGAVVVMRDLNSDLLDAVSQKPETGPPLLLVNERAPGARCRFSVAHEIGHLIMHIEPGKGTEQEQQADAFASEFLMPAKDISEQIPSRLGIAELASLKQKWGVSMAALLRRGRDVGVITDWQYRNLAVEMSTLGYRTAEPMEIPLERPSYMEGLLEQLLKEEGMASEQVAYESYLKPSEFTVLYVNDSCSVSQQEATEVRL